MPIYCVWLIGMALQGQLQAPRTFNNVTIMRLRQEAMHYFSCTALQRVLCIILMTIGQFHFRLTTKCTAVSLMFQPRGDLD